MSEKVKFITGMRFVIDELFSVDPVLEVKYREAVISSGGGVTMFEETDWENVPTDIVQEDKFKYYG